MGKTDVVVYAQGDTPQWGTGPAAPTNVTSITRDAGATVSFWPPTNLGTGGAITSYTVTPYIGASAQTPTTVNLASTTSITGAFNGDSQVYRQVSVSGLTNSTAYTFTVKATNSAGTSVESVASGANTPLAGLVFGDDFNGPAGAAPDPEWWVYSRCGFLAQDEVQWYKPDHCVLDGAGNLKLTATADPVSGQSYPSDNSGPHPVTQDYTSGACQSNTKTWYPAAGNTMSYQARLKVNSHSGENADWPGFFWLNGQYALTAWKTDPGPNQWNDTDHAEIDVAEWQNTGGPNSYLQNTMIGGSFETDPITDLSDGATAFHTYECRWKPGVSARFYRDNVQKGQDHTRLPASGAQFVLLLYYQLRGTPVVPNYIYADFVRVFDQNLG